jgi:capsid protein
MAHNIQIGGADMDEIMQDFKKALQEAQRRGINTVKVERQETELDRAVARYKEEQEKAQRLARFFA